MKTWPTRLPLPRVGSDGQKVSNILRTEMESGYARQRLMSETKFEQLEVSFILNAELFDAFKTFYNKEISQGADWFRMSLRLGSLLKSYPVQIINGLYKYTMNENDWYEVTMSIDVDLS